MGITLLKKTCLLFLLISASLIVTSSAGRRSSFATNLKEVGASHEDEEPVHQRLLRANSKDYGSYDPAPTFVKPPFKLIPN